MQRQSVTSVETARSLVKGPSWGGGGGLREKCVFCVLRNCSVFYLSFVYGRSQYVGGAKRRGKFSSLEDKHSPSIKYYDSVMGSFLCLFFLRYRRFSIVSHNRMISIVDTDQNKKLLGQQALTFFQMKNGFSIIFIRHTYFRNPFLHLIKKNKNFIIYILRRHSL